MSASLASAAAEAQFRARRRYGKITEAKLERWLGGAVVDSLLFGASGCYVPVPIAGIPASIMRGEIVSKPWWEIAREKFRDERGTGFTSLSDLISEATTGGKKQARTFSQIGVGTQVIGHSYHWWQNGPIPAIGANASAPPGGTVPNRTTTGALGQEDPGGSDTLHITTLTGMMSVVGSIMVFDKLFAATTAANPGTGAIAVTGLQTRYTGAAGTPEYAAGVVITNRTAVALPATLHNITYTYTDQDNNAGNVAASVNNPATARIVGLTDMPIHQWAASLAAGDTGARQLTQIQFSASPATGQVEHILARPLAILPCPVANVGWVLDGINSAFNLIKVMSGAAITMMDFVAAAVTAAPTCQGNLELCSG